MPFLFSLFCRQGRDSRSRTIFIALLLLGAMLCAVIQLQEAVAWVRISALFGFTIFIALIAWAGAERRLNDSLKSYKLARVVLGLWFIQGVVQILYPLTEPAIGLSVVALLSMARLAWFAPHNRAAAFAAGHEGRLGYSGPSKFGSLGKIEPLIEHTSESLLAQQRAKSEDEYFDEFHSPTRVIWDIFPKEPKMLAIGIIGLASLLFGLLWPHELPLSSLTRFKGQAANAPLSYQHSVQISEQLELFLQDEMLIIRWLGTPEVDGLYWSLATAKGDQRCAEMVFDNDKRYRPLQVDVRAQDQFYARFSPLDTNNLLHDIAQQGHFTLCDYQLDLTGSKEQLKQNPVFDVASSQSLTEIYPSMQN